MKMHAMRLVTTPALLCVTLALLIAPSVSAVPVTVTITKVDGNSDGLEGIGRGEADLYAGVVINGATFDSFNSIKDDDDHIEPFWTFSQEVGNAATVPVTISIWDHDECDHPFCSDTGVFESDDDKADANSSGASDEIHLTVDTLSGKWSGDQTWPANCLEGTGDSKAKVCWEISTLSSSGDADADGLLDGWEKNGFDADNNGTVDVDLPAMGANPNHKDLFLELDSTPGQATNRAGIQAIKAAFTNAPLSNPDGVGGVTIHIDTGNLSDPTASETGAGANSCGDGVDNDGDGMADGADPDCLVGDNLGGGNVIPTYTTCELDSGFYAAKAGNFNKNRRWIFRYAISTQQSAGCTGSGGQGEIGGNDFTEFNHDGGTIMHELGHTLNLRHGGNENANCKPNYVSVMNYDNQFGINQNGGGTILDYSPPRFTGGRGLAPLLTLKENALNEGTILDGTDPSNRFVFANLLGAKVQNPLNAGADWNGDGDTSDSSLTVNINTNATGGGPKACSNGDTDSTLNGFNDWPVVSLPFRQFGDSDDGAVNPVTEPEITLQELKQLQTDLNTTDLQLSKDDSPDPVVAGTTLTYSLSTANGGPNPAGKVRVTDTLPTGVSYVGADSPGCTEGPAGTVTCEEGELLARANRGITITTKVAADLVYNAGAPTTVTNTAVALNRNCPEQPNAACPDGNPSDNTASQTTKVVAAADLKIVSFTAQAPPSEIIVGEPVDITLKKVITNLGPSAPMDVKVTPTVTPPSGAVAVPKSLTLSAAAVGLNEQRTVDEVFTLTCNEASHHLFTFDNVIAPARPDDTDPDLSNNTASLTLDIECVVPVKINIKPGGRPNPINFNEASVPLAVLTTQAGEYGLPLAFDATLIDPLTVRFGRKDLVLSGLGGAAEIHNKGHVEKSIEWDEKTRDGDLDMVLHFRADATGLSPGATEACVKGGWTDSAGKHHKFFGCDDIVTKPK